MNGSMKMLYFILPLVSIILLAHRGDALLCTDHFPNCPALAIAGYCRRSAWTNQYVARTRRYCRKSCGLCHCKNVYSSCVSWASHNYCAKQGSMWEFCPKSCGLCGCTDDNSKCNRWAKDGWCLRRPTYMLQYCRKSCNACGCIDLYKKCKSWKKMGHCVRYQSFMRVYCRRSCHHCGVKPIKISTRRAHSKVNSRSCGKPVFKRVVGGRSSTPGKYPWMVGIVTAKKTKKVICGGSLITDRWVLTAAHCFIKREGKVPGNYLLRIGEHHINKKEAFELVAEISKIISHPKFDVKSLDNDIALLKLKKRVTFKRNIAPICLSAPNYKFKPGTSCIISGWGAKLEDSEGATELHEAKVPLIDHTKCNNAFSIIKQSVTKNMICAGHVRGGIDTCEGDSGGPLVCPKARGGGYEQVGIVSWGYGCARKGLYGVYTDVKLYRKWIDSVINA